MSVALTDTTCLAPFNSKPGPSSRLPTKSQVPDELLYRVRCESDAGIELSPVADAGVWWEGSEGNQARTRHRFLVHADDEEQAVQAVRSALAALGSFDDWEASPVLDAKGKPWRGAFYRKWDEVAWSGPPERAALTDVERNVLGELLNAGEATWIVMEYSELDRRCLPTYDAAARMATPGTAGTDTRRLGQGQRSGRWLVHAHER